MHEYDKADIQGCLGRRRLLFIGDSTTRQIFWAIAMKLDREAARNRTIEMLEKERLHEDLDFVSSGVTLEFRWDPYLNSSALEKELHLFKVNSSGEADEDSSMASAALVLLGAPGLWYARSGQENYMKEFKDAIDNVIPFMDHLPQNGSKPVVVQPQLASPNLLLLAPIQVPRYESLSSVREETITPEKIDQMNEYLQQASAYASADVLWSYSRMTSSGSFEYQSDGLHPIENVATRKADVLLNLRCNNVAAANGSPFLGTCCTDYGQLRNFQLVILFMGMLVVPTIFLFYRYKVIRTSASLPSTEILKALMVLGLVVSLCFFADRTQLFEKSQKQFHRAHFTISCSVAVLIGLASMRRSKCKSSVNKPPNAPFDFAILSRDQTDEWKGWMQAFILIYHYNHGSQHLLIYQLVRILVASYLFMTGFGHSLYFLQKQDYSLTRISSVMIRINLLSCSLPYIMGTDYLFYYFAPLVSFWFFVVYITLRIGHGRNGELGFLFGKILFSCTLTTASLTIPSIWDFVFWFLQHTCKINWNSQEWRFRTSLDMYIVYVGMVVAILVHQSSRIPQSVTNRGTGIDTTLIAIITRPRFYKIIASISSLLLLWEFWIFRAQFSRKEDYNLWQPYISFLPIIGFIGFRNSTQTFRNYHSVVFAWVGRCSLETFILQYHIWLAADTKGLLRIGIWNEWFETALLTILFLWISHVTANATRKITTWILGGSKTSPAQKPNMFSFATDEMMYEKDSPQSILTEEQDGLLMSGDDRCTCARDELDLKWKLTAGVLGFWACNILSS
jgi:hypothetical protein